MGRVHLTVSLSDCDYLAVRRVQWTRYRRRLSRYETGVHEPPFGIACKLARALHVPSVYFYCEDDGLARLLLHWQLLSKSERTNIASILESKLHSKASS